jgi:hypothetical protein
VRHREDFGRYPLAIAGAVLIAAALIALGVGLLRAT